MPIWPSSVSGRVINWVFINSFKQEYIEEHHVNDLRKALDVLDNYCSIEKATILNGHYVSVMSGHFSNDDNDHYASFEALNKSGYVIKEEPIGIQFHSKCTCTTVGTPSSCTTVENYHYNQLWGHRNNTYHNEREMTSNLAVNSTHEYGDGPSVDGGRCGSNREGGEPV